jgi:integrase
MSVVRAPKVPSYRRHKPSGQAVVTLNGRDIYLGKWKSAASHRAYQRLIAEWAANGRTLGTPHGRGDLSVNEMLLAYCRWATGYYRESAELRNIKLALRPLKELYGKTVAGEFGPLALKAVRQRMIDGDLCRKEINKRIGRIVRVFKWAVENELIPPSVFHGLKAVPGLRAGRTDARESEPVKPVPDAFVDAIRNHVRPQVWAMIELQRLTGMRPGEVTIMRTCDLDTSGGVWIYTPERHKTQHHGHTRQIFIGPKAQSVLRPWLKMDLQAYLFSPREAVAALRAERQANRKTPLSCGNRAGTNRKTRPKRTVADVYSVLAYRVAIRRGCDRADATAHQANPEVPANERLIPYWHPHQLRHNAATHLRREFGLDVARVILGHRSPVVTEIYAEVDAAKAREVMSRVG